MNNLVTPKMHNFGVEKATDHMALNYESILMGLEIKSQASGNISAFLTLYLQAEDVI